LQSIHGNPRKTVCKKRKNPVPSHGLLRAKFLRKGYTPEQADEMARREVAQAEIFLSEPRRRNPKVSHRKYGELVGFLGREKAYDYQKFGMRALSLSADDRERIRQILNRGVHASQTAMIRHRLGNPASGPTKIYGLTEKIFMTKTSGPYKGKAFVHTFKPGVSQIGLPKGTILTYPGGKTSKITTRSVLMTGKKDIWGNFPA
jgi:hypothetical protein